MPLRPIAPTSSGLQRRICRIEESALVQPFVQRGAVRVVAPGMVPIAGLDAAEQLLLKNSANSSCSCPIPCKRASQPIHLPPGLTRLRIRPVRSYR